LKVLFKQETENGITRWSVISKEMNCGFTPLQCACIWNNKYNPQYTHGPWTSDEYKIFTNCVNEVGDSDGLLDVLSLKIPLRNRKSLSCRIYNWKKKEKRQKEKKMALEKKKALEKNREACKPFRLREKEKKELKSRQ
jgi:hypothetical protein